jgi:phosphate transport system protein
MRVGLQEELDQLEASLQEEGELVRRALRGSLNALGQQDEELADEVIAFDDEVDRCYFGIETNIQSLLARQAPAAQDLRLVLAILHDNLHLERMADYCVTVAKLTKLVHDAPQDATLTDALEDMGTRAEEMIQAALDSFASRDVESAESLVDMDELIDAANRRVVHQILSISADPDLREWGLRMLLVSRCLERIGDHAVDIGEQTAFLVSGQFREFTDASH